MKRVVRHRGQALLLRERAERKAHAPVAPERVLEGREPPGDAVDAVGRRPLTHEEPLRPGHPGPVDRLCRTSVMSDASGMLTGQTVSHALHPMHGACSWA